MTDRERDDDAPAPGAGDDATRAEHDWLIAREANPAAPPPSAKDAAAYAKLEALIGALPDDVDDDDSWRAEVLRQAAEMSTSNARPPLAWWRRPKVHRALIGSSVLVAAAVVLLVLRPHPGSSHIELAYHIERPGTQRADPNEVVVHDTLVSRFPAGNHDLRLYRPDGRLAARCPAGPACTQTAEGSQLDVELDAAGRYSLFLLVDQALPIDLQMTDFIKHVHDVRANGQMEQRTIDVK